jgi:hypothetical protein
MEPDEPLFVFANVTYDTGEVIDMPRGYKPTSRLTVTCQPRQATPEQLLAAGVRPNLQRQRIIDDFRRGWQDWFLVAPDHRHHWNFKTHKVNDPAFVGPHGASLAFGIETTVAGNRLAVVMETDGWRGYTGRKTKRYTALVDLPQGWNEIQLAASQFVTPAGEVLSNFDYVTGLIFTPGDKELPETVETVWQGDIPTFRNLRWEGGLFARRPKPYLRDVQ